MAKSKPANPTPNDKLTFKCAKCRTKLRVTMQVAGRFMTCPKCNQQTAVPANQAEADEDMIDYGVSQFATEVTENCIRCGKKMRDGAVLCTNCGYDYRKGKTIEFKDKTNRAADEVSYGDVFGVFFGKEAMGALSHMLSIQIMMYILATVGLGVILGVSALLAWAIPDFAVIIGILGLVLVGVVMLFAGVMATGAVFQSCSGLVSQMALKFEHTPDTILRSALYQLPVSLVAFPPLVLVNFLIQRDLGDIQEFKQNIDGYDWNEFPWALVVAMFFAAGYALVVHWVWIGTYGVDATLNVGRAFYWFGRCFVDILLLLLFTFVMYILFAGSTVALFTYLAYMFKDDPDGWALMIIGFFGGLIYNIMQGIVLAGSFASFGMIMRKNSEW